MASGSWSALELVKPAEGDGRVPDPQLAKRVLGGGPRPAPHAPHRAGPYGNVVRIIPPLVTTADEIDRALAILDEALVETVH